LFISYIVDRFSLDLANIIRARTGLVDHLHRHGGEDSVLPAVAMATGKIVALCLVSAHHVSGLSYLLRDEEARVRRSELIGDRKKLEKERAGYRYRSLTIVYCSVFYNLKLI
jgi:hypothetical protein